ncbi:TIGR02466 family protein [Actinomadura sp. DC4]|uniref:TIGR02466 family protein n=1 Tax=Actinomadura sp. DC4 TaxID=3055069 RepID=UPI0025B1256F|nr:TIGR02466 family protein [Actinomadura sp. DC4]MDN3360128.1 TIGR02466 family protein [Actinomadura sp. DC4]
MADTASATPAGGSRTLMQAWRTPIYVADVPDADQYNRRLRTMILEAEKTDAQAANFGGIDAIKSSQTILRWEDPEIDWFKAQIVNAVTAMTQDTLGDAANEVTQGIEAEGWAVVYRGGGSLRPHTHHDSAWSGVYYVSSGAEEGNGAAAGPVDAGYLQLLDPRPAAIARQASKGPERIQPVPGRMVAFPGWLPHSVQSTLTGSGLRICIAWNVAYDKTWQGMS